jgi:hypothetical protein
LWDKAWKNLCHQEGCGAASIEDTDRQFPNPKVLWILAKSRQRPADRSGMTISVSGLGFWSAMD